MFVRPTNRVRLRSLRSNRALIVRKTSLFATFWNLFCSFLVTTELVIFLTGLRRLIQKHYVNLYQISCQKMASHRPKMFQIQQRCAQRIEYIQTGRWTDNPFKIFHSCSRFALVYQSFCCRTIADRLQCDWIAEKIWTGSGQIYK